MFGVFKVPIKTFIRLFYPFIFNSVIRCGLISEVLLRCGIRGLDIDTIKYTELTSTLVPVIGKLEFYSSNRT